MPRTLPVNLSPRPCVQRRGMIHLNHFGATLSVSDHKRWMLKSCRWLAVDVVDESLRNMPAACTRGQAHSRSTVHSRSDMHSIASVTALLLRILRGSSSVLLHVHRDRRGCWRRGVPDGDVHFHTVQCCSASTATGVGDGEPRTASSTFTLTVHDVALRPQRP